MTAAGAATLATWQGSAFQAAYVLGSVAGILLGVVMLRDGALGRLVAYLAIVANTVALGLYIPRVGVYIAVFSVVFLEVWYVLIGWHLHRLGTGRGVDMVGGGASRQTGTESRRLP